MLKLIWQLCFKTQINKNYPNAHPFASGDCSSIEDLTNSSANGNAESSHTHKLEKKSSQPLYKKKAKFLAKLRVARQQKKSKVLGSVKHAQVARSDASSSIGLNRRYRGWPPWSSMNPEPQSPGTAASLAWWSRRSFAGKALMGSPPLVPLWFASLVFCKKKNCFYYHNFHPCLIFLAVLKLIFRLYSY